MLTKHAIAPALTIGLCAVCSIHPAHADNPVMPGAGQIERLRPADVTAAAPSSHTGTIVIKLNMTVRTAVPTGYGIVCRGTVNAQDTSFATSYFETAETVATRSGSSATCSISIPYGWTLPSGSVYSASYSVTIQPTSTGNLIPRSTQLSVTASKPVPANGTTTTQTFAVVL